MYCEPEFLNVWRAVDDSAGREWEPGECRKRGNSVDGIGRLGGDYVGFATCANKLVTY